MRVKALANALALKYEKPLIITVPVTIVNNSYTVKYYSAKLVLGQTAVRSIEKYMLEIGGSKNVIFTFIVPQPPVPSTTYIQTNMQIIVEEYLRESDIGGTPVDIANVSIPLYIISQNITPIRVDRPDAPLDPQNLPYFTVVEGSCTPMVDYRWHPSWLATRFNINIWLEFNSYCSVVRRLIVSIAGKYFVIARFIMNPAVSRVELYDDVGWSYVIVPKVMKANTARFIEVGLPLEVNVATSEIVFKVRVRRDETVKTMGSAVLFSWIEWIRA